MIEIETTAIILMSSFWVMQSAVAVIKTRKARRLFVAHQRWIDQGVETPEVKRVTLIVSLKGVSENFDRFMDFVLTQDYPSYQVLFVTESTDDPAYGEIQRRLIEFPDSKARILVAGEAIKTGQKVHNQCEALKQLEADDQLIAFADGDLYGRKDWLSCLVIPLNLGQADFTTGYRWFMPANQRLPNRIITLIGTAIEPMIGPNWRMCLWGGSMAMTREVYEELNILKYLKGSVSDDARISQVAKQAGKRMRYVRSAAAPSPVDFTWQSLFEFGRRQYFVLRIYQPLLWWMAMLILLLYLASLSACLIQLAQGNQLMLAPIAAAIGLNLYRTKIRCDYLHLRFSEADAAELHSAVSGSWWLDPVVNTIHLLMILSSSCGRQIIWAGIRYRITGPQQTEISGRDT